MSERGWDQAALARAANVNQAQVTRWLGEGVKPSIEAIRRVCRALGRDMREGLIVTGTMTERELGIAYSPSGPTEIPQRLPDIHHFSDVELLAEIRRRLIVANRLRMVGLEDEQTVGEQLGTDEVSFDTSTRPPAGAEDESAGRPGAQD
jgi:transcriptional regulator with XRE-family HTH domain